MQNFCWFFLPFQLEVTDDSVTVLPVLYPGVALSLLMCFLMM